MTNFCFELTDSLEKVLPKQTPRALAQDEGIIFGGESYSFQLAYTCTNDNFGESDCHFSIGLATDFPGNISMRKVGLVPAALPCHGTWDDNYFTTSPGLLPDLLTLCGAGTPIKAVPMQWRAIWFEADPSADAPAGDYTIRIALRGAGGDPLCEKAVALRILPEALPPQTLFHTEWFHTDCLADYYQVPVFSEEHWRIIDNFMGSAVRHGVNLLLTPLFTPPLDTAKGGERTTVQLVDVQKTSGGYSFYTFDFAKLRRWIALCRKNGVENLEMSHLFTQWGAGFAPKIFVKDETGAEVKMFGWHTEAASGEYPRFLAQFLPALKGLLESEGMMGHSWFHISDEPTLEKKEGYAAAKAQVEALLSGCKIIDALSSYEFYRTGLVKTPVVCVDHIAPFIDAGVEDLWTYYCTAQALEVPNRFMAMPSARSRVMGVLLYLYKIKGFLHWGFNFYNSQYSEAHIDPFRVTDAGEAFPSGDPFLVYPAPDGSVYESIRGMVLRDALFDLRALTLLESRTSRDTVVALLTGNGKTTIDFKHYPRDASYFTELRKKIAQML